MLTNVNLLDILVDVLIGGGILLVVWAVILFIRRKILRKKPIPKHQKLTDIKFPQKEAPSPKKSFFKGFFKGLINVLLAPFRLVRRFILFVFAGIKNLIRYFLLGLKSLIKNIFGGIWPRFKNSSRLG